MLAGFEAFAIRETRADSERVSLRVIVPFNESQESPLFPVVSCCKIIWEFLHTGPVRTIVL